MTSLGFITGVLTFTPYYHWRWEHALHHATSGDLDRRGMGDVWTLTVQEYLEASRWKRFAYRLARNPVVLFGLAPSFLFPSCSDFRQAKRRGGNGTRWPGRIWRLSALARRAELGFRPQGLFAAAVAHSDGGRVPRAYGCSMCSTSLKACIGSAAQDWDYATAALKGSSFYKLPKVLQWFSGNIGFHHIHHLSPRIPNYHLEKCHRAEPLFQTVKPVTLFGSLKSLTFRLWDEQRQRLVGYRALRAMRKQPGQSAL